MHMPKCPQWGDCFKSWHVGSHRWRNHPHQIFCQSLQGCSDPQNLGISIGLAGSSYNSVSTAMLHCDRSSWIQLAMCIYRTVDQLKTSLCATITANSVRGYTHTHTHNEEDLCIQCACSYDHASCREAGNKLQLMCAVILSCRLMLAVHRPLTFWPWVNACWWLQWSDLW